MAAMAIQVPMEINFWSFIFQLGMEISTTTGTKAVVNVCYSEKIETWQNSFIIMSCIKLNCTCCLELDIFFSG